MHLKIALIAFYKVGHAVSHILIGIPFQVNILRNIISHAISCFKKF